jgi:hypothetical protein
MTIQPLNKRNLPGIRARLAKLRPDPPRQWGALKPAGMVRRLATAISLQMDGGGGIPFQGNALARSPPVRRLALNVLPWPKGKIKVPASATPPAEGGVAEELPGLEAALERFREAFEADPRGRPEVRHPFFGRLSMAQRSRFHGKRIDHHCRRFGLQPRRGNGPPRAQSSSSEPPPEAASSLMRS